MPHSVSRWIFSRTTWNVHLFGDCSVTRMLRSCVSSSFGLSAWSWVVVTDICPSFIYRHTYNLSHLIIVLKQILFNPFKHFLLHSITVLSHPHYHISRSSLRLSYFIIFPCSFFLSLIFFSLNQDPLYHGLVSVYLSFWRSTSLEIAFFISSCSLFFSTLAHIDPFLFERHLLFRYRIIYFLLVIHHCKLLCTVW